MLFEKQHLRHCLLFMFQLKKNASEAKEMICSTLGENAVSYSTCKKWFKRFRSGNFNLQDDERPGQPKKVGDKELDQLLKRYPYETQTRLASALAVSQQAISKRLWNRRNWLLSSHREQGFSMPRRQVAKAKADSSKAKPGKKTKKTDENGTSSKKRVNDKTDEPASKKVKLDPEASKSTAKSDSPATKKGKNEPKQMLNKTSTNLDEIDFECMKPNMEGKKYNLKICTWNVSGLRAVIKKNGIDYITKENADIIALQETKCDKDKIPDEIKLSGYHHYFFDSKKSGYCGVGLLSKQKPISVRCGINNPTFDIEGRIITAEFPGFYVANVYVPNAGQKLVTLSKRLEWNKIFRRHMQELDRAKPVIICGDMNVAHHEIDLKNPKTNTKNAGFTQEERVDMTYFLAAGFVDTFRLLYPDTEGAYTFWSYFANARSKNIGWRLDYFLISERLKNKVCDNIIRKQVYGSDHCPVILYINL